MRKFVIAFELNGEQVEVRAHLKSPKVVEAFMDLVAKGKTKQAQELILNEVIENKEQLKPIFEKYPLFKASVFNKVLEALGFTTEALIKEIEEGKTG